MNDTDDSAPSPKIEPSTGFEPAPASLPGEPDLRERLLDSWEAVAPGWARQAERWREVTAPVTSRLLAAAAAGPGDRVLELAAGGGDVGLAAAPTVLPGGSVTISDALEPMLALARERAEELGLTNVEFEPLQLEWLKFDTAAADVVVCRFGLMFALDPLAALKECRRVLKPGGRLAIAVWDLAERNPWKTITQSALAATAPVPGPPATTTPGPPATTTPGLPASTTPGLFALSDKAALGELLGDAGFFDVTIQTVPISRRYDSLLDLIGVTRDQSSEFASSWAQLSDGERGSLRERLRSTLAPFTDHADGAFVLPGSALVARAEA